MRSALAFLAVVLVCATGAMYLIAWRGGDLAEQATASPPPASAPGIERTSGPSAEPAAVAEARPAAEPAAETPGEVWYQYTDATGSVHFASSLEEIPRQWRARAGRIEMSSPRVQRAPSQPRPARRRARGYVDTEDQVWGGGQPTGEVIIYTTSWCGYCRKAIAHLEERGVDYVNKDIEDDADAEREYLEKSGGRRGVPLIDVGGQIMQGYSRSRLDQMLDAI
jgi:glutaredoxin